MDLKQYCLGLIRRRATIGACALAGMVLAAVLTTAFPPSYSARATLYVSVGAGIGTSDLLDASTFIQQQIPSYTRLASSELVLDPVIEELGLRTEIRELAESIRLEYAESTTVIGVVARNDDPARAADIANAVSASLAAAIKAIEQPSADPAPVAVNIVDRASPAVARAAPNPGINLLLGLTLGTAVGIPVAIGREALDTSIRTESDVHGLSSAPIIARIRRDDTSGRTPLFMASASASAQSEAVRQVRNYLEAERAGGRTAITVTSALPGEGRTTAAINCAIALQGVGLRTALVEADLRNPAVAEYMGLAGFKGLTTVLTGTTPLEEAMQPWGDGMLQVLAAGPPAENPGELLASKQMISIISRLSTAFESVVLDSPPILSAAEGAAMGRLTEGALVVIRLEEADQGDVAESLRILDIAGAPVLGFILNEGWPRRDRRPLRASDRVAAPPVKSSPGTSDGSSPLHGSAH